LRIRRLWRGELSCTATTSMAGDKEQEMIDVVAI